ncbi:MAG TPA: helix-turn-helix domain-containing protein, partial [Gaiellales bacterium]|nr:helix-turn-helix domain-containing protein [Gaiellales bacterium]
MLELIRESGSVSRAEVARRSGLSKPTVSQALSGLLDSRLVREVGRESGRKGPGAVLFELNPSSGWVVGL